MSRQISIVCENFHTFYDARVLEFLPTEIKKIFKEISRREYRRRTDKTVFLNLVYNFFAKRPPEPSYITGPYTLTYHADKVYGKQIYVFGEWHGYMGTCAKYGKPVEQTMKINKFLSKVFSTSSVFIDFYLEYQAYRDIEYVLGHTVRDIILRDVFKEVQGCLYPNPPKCKWNTVRVHFTDLRTFEKEKEQASFLMKLHNYEREWLLTESDVADLKIIINRYRDPNAFIKFIFEEAAKIPLLNKEMERSTLRMNQFEEILYNFLTDPVARPNYFGYREIDLRNFREGALFHANMVRDNTMGAQNILMDFYQLSRIFKKFKVKPGDNQPIEPHHVISYAGNNHAIFLRSALKTLGFARIRNSKLTGVSSQCLDVRGLVPLFSDKYAQVK